MTTFIQDISKIIHDNHTDNLKDIVIIIPNKRAAVYIQKHLSELIVKAFIAPKINTINEWVDEFTEARILTQTELLFLFYNVYVRYEGSTAEPFNEFLTWAKIILSDFDEIDRYLVEPKAIFRDLKHIKDIDNWSFNAEELSNGQEKFLSLWEKLPKYYQLLNEKLITENQTYQGKAYKKFSTYCKTNNPGGSKHFYFLGFNAFSTAEKEMIRGLKKQKLATTFFDIDALYINNEEHEAGHFYRKLDNDWQNKAPNLINSKAKQITIIETAQQVAQTKFAGSILKDFKSEELNSTAIVLADESLLIPLSRSLPAEIEKANITMGYPIKYSHLKSLIDNIFEFQQNAQKFKTTGLYYKILIQILDHSYVQELIGNIEAILKFKQEVITHNYIYISQNKLFTTFKELEQIKALFNPWNDNTNDSLNAIGDLIQTLYNKFKEQENTQSVNLEILYHFSKGIQKFTMMYSQYEYDLNLKSFKTLLYQFWQNESLSFLGNPIEGLQVMGILETRTLDFNNLIVLGMNEGNLPKSNFSNSLIMRELKLFHNMPIEEDKDAIFAHHFYRLLHRSNNVYLTYNSFADGLTSGEKSRFITQLENELDRNVDHNIKHYTYTGIDKKSNTSATSYQVTKLVEQKLDALFARGLSPSALNTFLRCPLDFYYTYILNLREENEVEEAIEASTFGTMIHHVLEHIFKDNFLDKKIPLSIEILNKEKKNLKQYLEEEYLLKFSKNDFKYGQNKLSFEVSLTFLKQFVDFQIKELQQIDFPIFIQNLEEDLEANFLMTINGLIKPIKIKGQADRIDQFGSTYRIVDYKSGKCNDKKIEFSSKKIAEGNLTSVFNDTKKSYGIQLLMYATMFKDMFPNKNPFSAGIISMVNIKDWIQNTKVAKQDHDLITDELLELFYHELEATINKMYDPNFIYEHNPKSEYCEFCNK